MSQFGAYKEPILKQFRDEDSDHLQELWGDSLRMAFEHALSEVESPIEAKLLLAFFNAYGNHTLGEIDWVLGDRKVYLGKRIDVLQVAPQFQVDGYRLDFAVHMRHQFGRMSKIAVECDGHDYHERTKEQAARDKRRDRDLALSGWKVLRFTGSEIHKDAESCADHVLTHVENDSIFDWQDAHR